MAGFVSAASGASHPEPGGGIYIGTVTHVGSTRRVAVKVPMLGITITDCSVVFSTPKQPLKVNERVLCAFIDHNKNNLVVIGALDRSYDVFALQTYAASLDNRIDALESQVSTLQSQVSTLQS